MPAVQPPIISTLASQPGVKRDGTNFDSSNYNAAQWVRFQRGRPRKMGGYRLMSDLVSGPVRATYVDARDVGNTVHSFSTSGVEALSFDDNGVGGGINVRTPAGFAINDDNLWQASAMYSSGGGGFTALIAAVTPDASNIASDVAGKVYQGDITGTGVLTKIQDGAGDIAVSGGACVLQPFLFVYGSNGLIRNSNPNDYSVATGWSGGAGFANTANVAGSKIVRGMATRGGGASPAGLFWALDALIRVTFVGGTTIWNYDTVSDDVSILSKASVVEYAGVYYWIGVDRFYVYNGVVQELPNDKNLNFFFDNLNPLARNKVWALSVPRFGEIWWFFPSGSSTECNHAIIYNVREQLWYDTALDRSAGSSPKIFTKPIMAGGDARETMNLTFTGLVGNFSIGQAVTGGTSGAVGTVARVQTASINVTVTSGNFIFGETITTSTGSASVSVAPYVQNLDSVWLHETGTDRVYKQDVTAIQATFETANFQYMTGGPTDAAGAGPNVQTRLARLEPDFVMTGSMNVRVAGHSYAQGTNVISDPYPFDGTTEFIDFREQRREMTLVFESNEVGGDFQMGRLLITTEPGDARG